MEARNLELIDPGFPEDLENSQPAVACMAVWLIDACGYPTTIHPQRLRPHVEQRHEYADKGDLTFIKNGEPHRGEVKERPTIDFHSIEDFPWPTVIVDKRHRWDQADPKPYAYFIVNASLTGCFIILGSTFPHWIRNELFYNGRWNNVYECPLTHVTYTSIL